MPDRSLESVYDRRRLLEAEVVPPKLESLKDITWEHQAQALQLGYRSVLEMAVDLMIDEVTEIKKRLDEIERMRNG